MADVKRWFSLFDYVDCILIPEKGRKCCANLLMNACFSFVQETDPADGDGLDCLLGRRGGSQDVAAHARVRHGTSGLHRQGSKLEAHPGIRHRNASRWIGMCLKVVSTQLTHHDTLFI